MIYVGKAKNLRARLSSYFQDVGNLHQRTATMVTTAASVEWTVVNTEVEALQLEYSWIKEFDPRFNVKYRDDKSYPWLAVTVGDEFPRVMVGRGAKRKGTRYFGPYSHAWAIRETVDILLRVFPMRSCSNGVFKRSGQIGRPCLLGYIDKCAAPCVGNVTAEEHRAIVDDFCDFMAGQTTAVHQAHREGDVRRLRRARTSRRRPGSATTSARCSRALEKQAVVLGDGTDADVIALAEDPLEVAVQIFYVRGGRIRGQRGWVADRVEEGGTAELVEDFLLQLYAGAERRRRSRGRSWCPALPPDVDDVRAAARRPARQQGRRSGCRSAATRRRSRRPSPATPAQSLALHKTKRASDLTTRNRALEEIQRGARARRGAAADRVLRRVQPPGHRGGRVDGGLRGRPGPQERVPPVRHQGRRRPERRRLDARGDHPAVPAAARRAGQVASCEPGDDRAAVRCWSTPRPAGRGSSPTRPGWSSSTAARRRSRPPSARSTSSASTTSRSCGLAKRLEEVWLPGQEDPVILRRSSEGLYLLQRIRDEAHRFAITHHRSRRSKSMVESLLDDVPGLGEVRRKTLLKHFGSLKKLREAEVDDIAQVPGIGPAHRGRDQGGGGRDHRHAARLSPSTPPRARSRRP